MKNNPVWLRSCRLSRTDAEPVFQGRRQVLEKYFNKVLEYHNPVVMLQGEFIFTFRLATKLKAAGIKVVAGRSERIVVESVNSEGIPVKKSEFHFAGFMEY